MSSFVVAVFLGICALQDIKHKRISNWLTLSAIVAALAYLLVFQRSWLGAPPLDAALAATFALLLSLPGYALGKFGGADVKLLLFIGLAGSSQLLLLCIAGAGLAYAGWVLAAKPVWPLLSETAQNHLGHMAPAQVKTYPFAPFILAGFLTAIFLTEM
ncbi:MAG: prepilin peptidase [Pseudomonadaceae bacterium]|uniref:Prepilin type IV endopeptidase peptidase domain-containing protein n=1 Tax=Pseudomonas marincola TaxID=437900 RepID=A0A1I7D3W0_9PSED|nr:MULTISPECIES: prepilin peptidase [Pseudomonas]MAC00011.1 prepilin peptidase [Pseudomonadaceae bacterium]HCP55837.1 prepilin peptidase [Pseudomonas sp.]MBQ57201.1 prepilin peptidase [Pseudomonadaceae bacterium]OEO23396.1 hypothetical protein AX279_24120 [Pseudomonas sp. J237]CAE6889580.1 Prepilin peptidase CpaA [Pseudomonas marincola]